MTTRKAPPLWLLALITVSGTLAMHMFVPALPEAAKELNASIAAMQLTISLYIVGVAGGQLVYGPLSDAVGRRPMLLFGLGLYVIAGVAAALATSVHFLIGARLFQAIGGCAGLALGRAVVRDTASVDDSVRNLALINLMVIIGPGFAPLFGSGLAANFGWRSVFVCLAILGAVTLACTWTMLPETGKPTGKLNVAALAEDYAALLRSPAYLGFAIGGGCSTTAIYGYIAAAPFIVSSELHRPVHEVGYYLTAVMGGIAVGSFMARQLIRRIAIERLVILGNGLALIGSGSLLLAALLDHLTVFTAFGLMMPYAIGAGLTSPAALTKAISVDSKRVGSASGLYGFSQMMAGGICTTLVGLGHGTALAAGGVLLAVALIGQMGFWVALRWERTHRNPQAVK